MNPALAINSSTHDWRDSIFNDIQSKTPIIYKEIKVIPYNNGVDNRFSDVLNVESSAVPIINENGLKYFNANQLDLNKYGIPKEKLNIVVGQFPTQKEVTGFWLKVSEEKYTIVNLVNHLNERGENEKDDGETPVRYIPYPDCEVKIFEYENMRRKVQVESAPSEVSKFALTVKKFKVSQCDDVNVQIKNEVKFLQFNHWEDSKVVSPEDFKNLLEGIKAESGNNYWIHCLAGIGRAGTVATGLILDRLIEQKKITAQDYETQFKELVLHLRAQRSEGFIQTKAQCELVYNFGLTCLKIKPLNQRVESCTKEIDLLSESLKKSNPKAEQIIKNFYSLPPKLDLLMAEIQEGIETKKINSENFEDSFKDIMFDCHRRKIDVSRNESLILYYYTKLNCSM